jgi:hypothetical protein
MKTWLYVMLFVIAAAFTSYSTAMDSQEIQYVVKPGDTIWSVVETYCATNEQTRAFVYETQRRNGGANIRAGQEIILIVPAK